jgi:two-component system, sensor histidine kinase and response regulator
MKEPITDGRLERDLERELRAFLARRLATDSGVSEVAHFVLGAMAASIAWRWVPHRQALLWYGAIALTTAVRIAYRRRAVRTGNDVAIVRAVRLGVVAVSLSWAIGLLVVGPQLPFQQLAWITVLIAGLISGGTSSLVADRPAFHILLVALLVPLGLTIELNGDTTSRATGLVLMSLYGIGMSVLYRRSHVSLIEQFRVAKRLELTERHAREARETAQRLVRVMESTTDHVGMTGPDGHFQYLNRSGRAMLGIGPDDDISGLTVRDLIPPRLRERFETHDLPTIMREGSLVTETALLHRDGREVPVSIVSIVHRSHAGEVEGFSAIARDVTTQVAAREALDRARLAAEEATAAKSALLANTSHEIRTPLNGILGMVELLLDTELSAEQRRSVGLIAESGETLLNTINDLLDLSKIEAHQLELEEIPFDLHHLLNSSVRLFSAKASAAKIELVSDVGDSVPEHVIGDPHRLRQVLANLIANAVKFTREGEVVLSVRSQPEGGDRARITFRVRDTGIGIAHGDLQRIFEPFRQVDASTTRHYGGTGLGLSIARRIVELHGSRLEVTSVVGEGSDFHFTIDVPVASAPATTRSGTIDLQGLRVLVTDDNAMNRRVLCEMLRWARCDVDDASTAEDAIAKLRSAAARGRPYRLLVSDLQMPGRDGFSLASDVRADPALAQTSIMVLTSAARRGDGERSRELGVAAYIQKPVSRVELLEAAAAAVQTEPMKGPALVTRQTMEAARRHLRILLAEDNPVNQEVATALLRKRGHEVVVVPDGAEALEALVTGGIPFDLVLMDVQMPRMDGVEATRRIRARDTQIPIVALTANVSADERQRCLSAGMNGYLSKPFKPHELFAAVEDWGRSVNEGAPAVNRTDDVAPVDLEGFRAMLDEVGIGYVADQMLRTYLGDAKGRIAALAQAEVAGDARAFELAAHAFKSGSLGVRAQALGALLQSAESLAADGNFADARKLLPLIQSEYHRVAAFLRDALKEG